MPLNCKEIYDTFREDMREGGKEFSSCIFFLTFPLNEYFLRYLECTNFFDI